MSEEPFAFTAWFQEEGQHLTMHRRRRRRLELTRHAQEQELWLGLLARTVEVTAHSREVNLEAHRQTYALLAAQQEWSLSRYERADFTQRWLIQQLKKRVLMSSQEVRDLAERWGLGAGNAVLTLTRYPSLFVSLPAEHWGLPPWIRFDMPFTPRHTSTRSLVLYEEDAVRFWLEYQHVPDEHEEWSEIVRTRVSAFIHLAPTPPYFAERRFGAFVQDAVIERRLGLVLDQLPQGRYFKVDTPHGQHVYSVNGRALLMDTPQGVRVVDTHLTLRFKEFLRGGPAFFALEQGREFLAACRAAGIRAGD